MSESMFSLQGKTAVITGGGGGIGQALALGLAQAGARVALLDSDAAAAERVAEVLAGQGHETLAVEADITRPEQVRDAIARIETWGDGADILVNNAGIARRGPAESLGLADWDLVVSVNMTGAFLMAQAVAPGMLTRGAGAIVNVASIMGLSGGLYPNVAYQTTKGALVNMTRALAAEWGPRGIRVNAIAPTFVRTPLTRKLLEQPGVEERILAATPLRRLADPEDMVGATVFLAGPAAGMITGQILAVDGGFLAI